MHKKFIGGIILIVLALVLVACGEPTATATPVPIPTATPRSQPTTQAARTTQSSSQRATPTQNSQRATQTVASAQGNSDLTAVRRQQDIVKTFTDAQGRTIKLVYGRGTGHGGDFGWAHILGKHINGIWYEGGTITTFPQAVGAKTPEAVIDLIGKSLQDKNPDNQAGGRRGYVYQVPGTNKDVFTVVGSDGTIITSYPVPRGSKDED
jgi:hypothetical protein